MKTKRTVYRGRPMQPNHISFVIKTLKGYVNRITDVSEYMYYTKHKYKARRFRTYQKAYNFGVHYLPGKALVEEITYSEIKKGLQI